MELGTKDDAWEDFVATFFRSDPLPLFSPFCLQRGPYLLAGSATRRSVLINVPWCSQAFPVGEESEQMMTFFFFFNNFRTRQLKKGNRRSQVAANVDTKHVYY